MKYSLIYREEFEADVEARNIDEAIAKFKAGECRINPVNDLWNEYFTIIESETEKVVREQGDLK